MEKRKARVRYTTEIGGREGYAIEIYSDNEWGLDMFYPIIASQLHWTIISKLSHLKDCGYDIKFV